MIGILAVLIGVGFGAEWLVRRALARARKPGRRQPIRGRRPCPRPSRLLTFAVASIGSFLAFEWPPLLRKIVLTLLLAFIAFRIVRAAARLLLAFGAADAARGPADAASPSSDGQRDASGFGGLSLVAGFLLFGWAIVSLMPGIGFSIDVARLVAFLFGLGMLADRHRDRLAAAGQAALRSSSESLLTLYLVALWLAWVAGLLGLLWIGIFALRAAERRCAASATSPQAFAGRAQRTGALGVVLNVLIVRGARAVVIAAAVAWLAYIWRVRAAALGRQRDRRRC